MVGYADNWTKRHSTLDIYGYTDYRKFLSDLYQARKGVNRAFSYRYIANKAGFSSPSFFGKILAGDTNISNQTLMRLVDVFQLVGPEAEYFELMVNFDRSSTQVDKQRYFQRMQAVQKGSGQKMSEAGMALKSRWFVSPVFSLVEMGLFTGDYGKLGRLVTPPITAQEVLFALDSLMQNHLIVKDEQGQVVVKSTQAPLPPSPVSPNLSKGASQTPLFSEFDSTSIPKLPKTTPMDLQKKILVVHQELQRLVRQANESPPPLSSVETDWQKALATKDLPNDEEGSENKPEPPPKGIYP